jgi:hypothetical protein
MYIYIHKYIVIHTHKRPDMPPMYVEKYSFKNHLRNWGKNETSTVLEIRKLVSREEYGSPVAMRRRAAPIFMQSGHTFGSWAPCLPGGGSGYALANRGSAGLSLNSPLSAAAS